MENGEASPHYPMFLTMSTIFPDGATEEELTRIYRPRPGLPFTAIRLGDRLRYVWTTFTPQQIDIDVRAEAGRAYLTSILDAVADAGVTQVRLDAVGYAIKTPGTTSFMTPETFAFIEEFTDQARARGVEVLVEVHSYYQRQIEIGRSVDLVYDFALPPLVLHALYTGDGSALVRWMEVRPPNAVTVLDTHDGIGVIDVGADQTEPGRPGLLTPEQIDQLVEESTSTPEARRHGRRGRRRQPGPVPGELDLLRRARRGRCAVPGGAGDPVLHAGVPQVYYGCAGRRQRPGVAGTHPGWTRHQPSYYTADEIAADLERPVVRALWGCAGSATTRCRLRRRAGGVAGRVGVDHAATGQRGRGGVGGTAVDLASGGASIESSGRSYGDLMELAER